MAIIKCKMCGGDLNILEDSSVCECEYCGTKQTVPKVDDEKKLKLFTRAGKLLRSCDFDKASGVFESIVADFPEEAEAYWGLVLCKYGIEYVDDPATGRKVPTCHRSSFDSVEDDPNFEQACENADAVARRVYREEARQIETLRKRILEVSGKEEPYDIFISYKELDEDGDRTPDSVIAQDIYRALTKEGYRVFFSRISLEGKLGVEYEPYIFAALNSAKVMIVVGTDYEYFDAVWVKNEWSRFLKLIAKGEKKTLIPVYKDMDPYDMPKELRSLAAQDMGKIGAMQDLVHGVEKIIGNKAVNLAQTQQIQQPVYVSGGPNMTALLERGNMALDDCEWDKARDFFDQVLSIDAKCGGAFLGLAMAEAQTKDRKVFAQQYIIVDSPLRKSEGKNITRARQFDPKIEEWFTGLDEKGKKADEEARLLREKAEAERREQEEQARQIRVKNTAEAMKRVAFAKGVIVTGCYHTLGIMTDGSVVATRYTGDKEFYYDQDEVRDWKDIVAISANYEHTVGLKANGTVVALGDNKEGQCNVSNWRDIVMIASGRLHSVGIKADGTVVAVGNNSHGQCEVGNWTDMVAIAAGIEHTVGLKVDGTVVAVGKNDCGECNVSDWTNIAAITAGASFTVGLKTDGSVVAVGENDHGQTEVGGWKNIIAVAAGSYHTVGLRADGTVVATDFLGDKEYNTSFFKMRLDCGQCKVNAWRNIVAIAAFHRHTVGLKADGTVVAVGENKEGQCEVSSMKLFDNVATIEAERKAAREKAEAEHKAKIEALSRERAGLQAELPTIKGLFSGGKRRQIEARLAEIDAELKKLR